MRYAGFAACRNSHRSTRQALLYTRWLTPHAVTHAGPAACIPADGSRQLPHRRRLRYAGSRRGLRQSYGLRQLPQPTVTHNAPSPQMLV